MKTVLIAGVDSHIGGALMVALENSGYEVIGSTRRSDAVSDKRPYLDLAGDIQNWQCDSGINSAVICAGVTKVAACAKDPVGSFAVNVEGVCGLIKSLVQKRVYVVYLSTNQVFDGNRPYPSPHDPVEPLTEYGKQREEVERRIRAWSDDIIVVRMTKVFGASNTLFDNWLGALKNGEVIRPFSDIHIAPMPLTYVVEALRLILDKRLTGIMHLSGKKDISYADIGFMAADIVGASHDLIQPVKSENSGLELEPQPKRTALNIEKTVSALGVNPPDVSWTIRQALTDPEQLCPR